MSLPPPWTDVRALFERALPLAEPERAALLAATERGDPDGGQALAAEVRSLLLHHGQASHAAFSLGTAAVDLGTSGTRPPPAAVQATAAGGRIGQTLGAWRVTAVLGRGGMGEVWLAERADGAFQGEAAIKVLKRGMDSAAVLARFAQEQQALARLVHPHIARLLDAGRTPDGLPYFVMERVAGRPIDQACRGQPLHTRLRLFLQLADAVSHAHRHLLVHRDLKPGNVLVGDDGGVKLLDFGIAKALDPVQDTTGDELTATGERPFTPHYASPEQVRGDPVTTATDIYGLGVLLYVLLTGHRPYGRSASTPGAAARSVLEEAPTKPSELSASLSAGAPFPASPSPDPALPGSAPARLLRGDLDTIVLKALAKEPAERYASVEAFAADVHAHLAGRPISARPATWHYVLRRLVARHRAATGAVVTGTLAVLVALATALWQAQRAEQARLVAERRFVQVRQLAHDLIFRYHDQVAALAGATATREALLADAVRFLDGLRAEAAFEDPGLAQEVAEGYFRVAVLMGEQHSPSQERLRESAAHLRKALDLQARYVHAPGLPQQAMFNAADMWLAQANQDLRAARLTPALQALQRARDLAERATPGAGGRAAAGHAATTPDAAVGAQGVSRLATIEGRLGQLLGGTPIGANLGRTNEAEPHLRRSLALMSDLLRAEPDSAEWMHQAAWAHQNLVSWLILNGRAEESLSLCHAMIALRDEAARLAPDNLHFRHQRGSVRASHAVALSHLGRHAEAVQVQTEVLALMQSTAAADPANRSAQRDAALSRLAAGRIHAMAGQAVEARALLETALASLPSAAQLRESGDFYLARMRSEALLWLVRSLPVRDAERSRTLAQEVRTLMAGEDDNAARRWTLAQALGEEARALHDLGRREEANTLAREATAQWQKGPLAQAPAQFRHWQARDELLVQTTSRSGRWPLSAARP